MPSATLHEADARAKDELGIEPLQLMEIAGWQVARIVDALLGGAPGKRIRVVAGSGNNGGDALVAARFLHQRGALVRVSMVRLKDPASLSAHHANTINRLGMRIDQAPAGINGSADLIVDGLLGTGTRPPLREPAPAIISAMNAAGRPIVAVDVPSGMDADTGLGAEQAVRATATVTLAPRNWDSCRRRTAAASSWPILGCRRACFPQPVTRSNRSIGRRTWWS